jgi:hypothetical protein
LGPRISPRHPRPPSPWLRDQYVRPCSGRMTGHDAVAWSLGVWVRGFRHDIRDHQVHDCASCLHVLHPVGCNLHCSLSFCCSRQDPLPPVEILVVCARHLVLASFPTGKAGSAAAVDLRCSAPCSRSGGTTPPETSPLLLPPAGPIRCIPHVVLPPNDHVWVVAAAAVLWRRLSQATNMPQRSR